MRLKHCAIYQTVNYWIELEENKISEDKVLNE